MADIRKFEKGEWLFRQLAGYFMSLSAGDSVKSIRTLAEEYAASIGLVSESISELEKMGVVRINRRGQLGSFLIQHSISSLWNAAMQTPLVIAHTLPSNRVYEGFSTGLKESFLSLGIETYFIFIRGSRTRLKALRDGHCHIAVMSHFSAQGLITKNEIIARVFPAGSFVGSHQVFFRQVSKEKTTPLRAAIDSDSYDQAELSHIEFNEMGVEWVPINFMNIQRCLLENIVDTAIWTADDMRTKFNGTIGSRPLSTETLHKVGNKNTMASLIVQAEDSPTNYLLQKALKNQKMLQIQEAVINGSKIPHY